MKTLLTTPSEELKLRLPWATTCGLACKAMILGLDFDQVVSHALEQGMHNREQLKEMKRG